MMVLGLMGLARNGQCAQKVGELFITPMIGGHIFEGNQDPFGYDEELEHGLTIGLGLGYQLTETMGVELVANMTDTIGDPYDVDIDVYPVRLEVLFNLGEYSSFVPYAAAGLGTVTFSAAGADNETNFMVDYGVGVKYYMTDSIALRADMRHLVSFSDTQNNFLYTFGVVFGFGGKGDKAPAHVVVKEVAPKQEEAREEVKPVEKAAVVEVEVDSDGDGVLDSADTCADTPSGVKVNAKGCPVDSDKDGVTDDKDKCPNTEAGVEVDEKGCPVVKKVEVKDSDNDGVNDDKDKCEGTPAGAKVDSRGCWVIKGLLFATGKTTIISSTKKNVDEVITVMKKNPDLKLEIQGYTDNKGSAAANKKLSDKRAKAVMSYIAAKGIAKNRMTAKGYGIENPVEANDTEKGRSANRRVELKPMP